MARHDDSGSFEKSPNDLPTFNAENMQNNMKAIHYSRTFMSIIGGVIAGISGFTGLTGFVFYFLVMAITSIGLIAKAGFTIHSYFDSWNQIIFDGILGGLLSFVLFWTYPCLYLSNCPFKLDIKIRMQPSHPAGNRGDDAVSLAADYFVPLQKLAMLPIARRWGSLYGCGLLVFVFTFSHFSIRVLFLLLMSGLRRIGCLSLTGKFNPIKLKVEVADADKRI
ncbi:hypothetical protein Vadar_022778 [Vaccinium darrowii]|uniref:Uncharacterized protein n=1 Tax=Vaccinium darrowii TaxID=229202 RepID=A0ACB7XJB2_9ERIC|nr:hypothetical protein Vadar_022778 [Vaccinium darrowii]